VLPFNRIPCLRGPMVPGSMASFPCSEIKRENDGLLKTNTVMNESSMCMTRFIVVSR